CVFYEMLTGRPAFQGESVSEILAAVLIRDADLGALPANLNPRIPDLLRRCLGKNPKRRWQAVGGLRADLEAIALAPHATPAVATQVPVPRPLWKRAVPIVATAIVFSGLAGITAWNLRRPAPIPITRFPLILPEDRTFTRNPRHIIAISPDGTKLVY